MAEVEKDYCNSIEYNYRISEFSYSIAMKKDGYRLNKKRKLSCLAVYVSVMYKLYKNVAISNKPPTYKDLNNFVDYSYTRIFI